MHRPAAAKSMGKYVAALAEHTITGHASTWPVVERLLWTYMCPRLTHTSQATCTLTSQLCLCLCTEAVQQGMPP
jgi:hypothetical protein